MKRAFFALSLLIIATVGLAVVLPAYLNPPPEVIDAGFNTPLPTRTPFNLPTQDLIALLDPATSTLGPTSEDNCTYPAIYWKEYPESWPYQMVIGGLVYTSEEARAAFNAGPGELRNDLVKQLYSAFLNILRGAESYAIHRSVVDASNWLSRNITSTELSASEQEIGRELVKALEEYNNGISGPGLCLDSPAVPTVSPSIIPSETATEAPTARPATSAPRPATEPPQNPPPPPPPQPTATPQPTAPPPTDPPPIPTATSEPPSTPATPTSAPNDPPTPTPTEAPFLPLPTLPLPTFPLP